MAKQYSKTFWFIFWAISIIFLTLWYLYWNVKSKGISMTVQNVMGFLPLDVTQKKEFQALTNIGDFLLKTDGQQKTLLVLFQNNMEIRPGGGFIGAFGIVKIKDGKVISVETHDLSNFDGRIPNNVVPPYPMPETLGVKAWKLRDSNFSPDFSTNAKKAQEFYYMGQGQEQFDGVVAITANVLSSILKITGPISIEGYPGTYDSENAVLSLEYQVEKAFETQGIDRGERKSVMSDLAKEIEKRVFAFSVTQKIELAKVLLADLNKKDIQLNFKDEQLQKIATNAKWTGTVDEQWSKDYLMLSDANLGAFKSDYYVKRSVEYNIDLSKDAPLVNLKITYEHTAKQKDWMTRDYTDYLRVYVPKGAWLVSQNNFGNTKFGEEFGKKYFGSIIKVPIGQTKTIEISYTLPKEIKNYYDLKVQKQAGLNDVPAKFNITKQDGSVEEFTAILNSDTILSELLKK
ncbi:MAG: DUF4012 domain-containing protein [bacterium]